MKTGTHNNELVALARDINEREQVIHAARMRTREAAAAWLREVSLQGQALKKAKGRLTHGMWMDWLRIHCPLISQWTANAYMRVNDNWGLIGDAQDDGEALSLRTALSLCRVDDDTPAKVPRPWPAYLDGIGRFAKAIGFVKKAPISTWPTEGRNELRQKLRPTAKELWPEKFKGEEDEQAFSE